MDDGVIDNLRSRELGDALCEEFYGQTSDIVSEMDVLNNDALEILMNDATARSICVSIKTAEATEHRSRGYYVWCSYKSNQDLVCTFHEIMAVAVCSTILKAVRLIKSQKRP